MNLLMKLIAVVGSISCWLTIVTNAYPDAAVIYTHFKGWGNCLGQQVSKCAQVSKCVPEYKCEPVTYPNDCTGQLTTTANGAQISLDYCCSKRAQWSSPLLFNANNPLFVGSNVTCPQYTESQACKNLVGATTTQCVSNHETQWTTGNIHIFTHIHQWFPAYGAGPGGSNVRCPMYIQCEHPWNLQGYSVAPVVNAGSDGLLRCDYQPQIKPLNCATAEHYDFCIMLNQMSVGSPTECAPLTTGQPLCKQNWGCQIW